MKHPQVINLNEDAVLAFSGDSVIDDTDQLPLGLTSPDGHDVVSVQVDINFFDVTTGLSLVTVGDAEMVYQSASDYWTILLVGEGTPNDIKTTLSDRHKYVAQISETTPAPNNMRSFKVSDFAVDNDSFEGVWMRMPYEVVVTVSEAWMRWYAPGDIGGTALFEAPAYEGGAGTTYATAVDRVTHRGAVVPVP